ncbi:hypothetical protein ACJ73_01217 [Blastomyces percursus]|uniref:Fungal-specific transcription factor domain-containing protein n=1 Tax=Blastomyces percursus TaxID=1658174 RepID=A0A1J9RHC0_9EURO|nr:hypothetical protein ACJ73_01217 [Blastomyces percursus]
MSNAPRNARYAADAKRLNLHCVRGLKLLWREDAAQRSIRFGREGSSKTLTPTKVKIGPEFQPVPLTSIQLTEVVQSLNGLAQPSPHRPLGHPLAQRSSVESFLLDYFIRGIAPFCSLSTGFNPYLSLVTPLALNYQQPHEPLRNILLAIAANQRQLLGDRTYEREAFLFKQKALHGLQNEINHRKPTAGAVATVLMLCFHDANGLTDGCTPSWTTHIRGGLQLMAMLPHQMCESETLKRFFVPQVTHSWLDDDDLEEIDVLMGCSRGLMTLINRISTLATKIPLNNILSSHRKISHFNTARSDIEAELRVLHQKLPSYASLQEDLLLIAETKRLAAILYLRERLGNPNGLCSFHPIEKFSHHQDHKYKHNNSIDSSLSNQATILSAVETSPSGFKARIANMIISLMENLPDSPTLLWPLFIVGNVGLDDEQHRRFVLDRLTSIQKTRNLGGVRRARMVVESAYRAKDIHFPRGKVWGDEGPGVISLP